MKKGTLKSLTLHRETLHSLTAKEASAAAGGITTSAKQTICTVCISCHPNTCRC